MSIDSTMAFLYAQTGLAAPLAHSADVAPHAAAAMSRSLAEEMARLESQQVEKTEKKKEGSRVGPDGRQGQGGGMFGSRRRKRVPFPGAADGEDDARPSGSPLIGNLLNVKI